MLMKQKATKVRMAAKTMAMAVPKFDRKPASEEPPMEGNPTVQMVLPMAEMMGWLRKGVGELIRQAGLQLMDLLMQEEVRELVGERSHGRRKGRPIGGVASGATVW